MLLVGATPLLVAMFLSGVLAERMRTLAGAMHLCIKRLCLFDQRLALAIRLGICNEPDPLAPADLLAQAAAWLDQIAVTGHAIAGGMRNVSYS